ncbi:MAG: CBS domain-containing protein [Desulfobacterales bacterium]
MITAEEVLKEKNREMICIPSDRTIREAVILMNEQNIGAVLVQKEGQIVGIWTERDLLHNMNLPDFDPDTALVADYMAAPLYTAPHTASILKINEMFLGLFIRHILVEKDGEYIGLLSIGDVLRASLVVQDLHIKELNAIGDWEYYEHWGWPRKKK